MAYPVLRVGKTFMKIIDFKVTTRKTVIVTDKGEVVVKERSVSDLTRFL